MRCAGVLSLIGILFGAGCEARDPLERMVMARTPSGFAFWRSHINSDSSAENRRRVDEALQEIRFKISGERELKRLTGEPMTSGTEGIDETLRERVNGRPLREVLQLGYELRVRRLSEELAGLEHAISMNAQLVTRPGDVESKQHLEGLHDRQMGRVQKYRADIAAAEQELAPLVAKTGRRLLEVPTDKPDEMPRRVNAPPAKTRV